VNGLMGFVSSLIHLALLLLPALAMGLLALIAVMLYRMMRVGAPAGVRPDSSSRTSWGDVAGVEEARDELMEVVEFLRDEARFRALGARVPRGVLLHGPPGTGKTLLARAVAGESGATFFSQSASSFVEVFAGVGASRIRKLFNTARKHAPAIVFIDELDAIGVARSGTGFNRESDQTLNQLLVELDGFADAEGVVVMASTNRLDTLDPALLRPGRFDRQVYVSPPDLAGRIAILEVHTRDKPLGPDVTLDSLARSTSGLTGADLENICNEAAIRAARARRDRICQQDVDHALDRVVAGLQSRRGVGDHENPVIANPEARHPLLCYLLLGGMTLYKVTIVPRGRSLGFTMSLPVEERVLSTRAELLDQLAMLLGGRAAEQVVFGEISTGAAEDLERVTAIARSMVFEWGMGELVASRTLRADDYALSEETKRLRDAEQARLCDEAYRHAQALLVEHRSTLDSLATRLLESETLERDEAAELLRHLERAPGRPQGLVAQPAAASEPATTPPRP
jgi:cell division protease FtsH